MYRLAWLAIPLSLGACGGGKSATTLSVTCTGGAGAQLVGASSIDVLGDVANGRPTMVFPDPTIAGATGSISVEPRGRCTIVPRTGG